MKSTKLPTPNSGKGQILVILALIFIGLIAIIGLAIDSGYLYVSYSRLRRSVDAAALSATTQWKKNVDYTTLAKSAREFLVLNGVPNTNSLSALVETCATNPGDVGLCTDPPRKLVRVTAREEVPLFFLSIVGLHSVPISVSSISEAATVDLVLVIDRSESMGVFKPNNIDQYPIPSIARDPYVCNDNHPPSPTVDGSDPSLWTGNCHPFHEVKSAALSFVNEFMDQAYDRVAIVVFDNRAYPVNFGTTASPVYFSNNPDNIKTAIRNLWMYDGVRDEGTGVETRQPDQYYKWDSSGNKIALKAEACPFKSEGFPLASDLDTMQPCRLLNATDQFFTIDCAGRYNPDFGRGPANFSKCGSTNMSNALWWTATIFGLPDPLGAREESLMVTILLTDGVPNSGYDSENKAICPPGTRDRLIYCNDNDPLTRHAQDPSSDASYDTDDATRDWADVLADPNQVGSLIFSIGLGPAVTSTDYSNPAEGANLLNYIAKVGQTNDYYQADPEDLQRIFLAIANKIATRLTQ